MAPRIIPACPLCAAPATKHRPTCPISKAARAQTNLEQARRSRDVLIREARAAGMSQQSIADAVGLAKRSIQLIEAAAD